MEAHSESAISALAVGFPSVEWFQHLARLMSENRALHEHLGFIDCTAQFTVLDGGMSSGRWSVQVTFEEFAVIDICEVDDPDRADFTIEATLATWRDMIESIARGHGRPELTQTLNYLSHRGAPLSVQSKDPLRKDLYFRYNQSLQEFVNASAAFPHDLSGVIAMPRKPGHFYIDETCIGCGACDHACPGKVDAIYQVQGDFLGRYAIVVEECIDCGFCVPLCPVACIHDARSEGVIEGAGGYTRIKELQAWARDRA